jgi:hypothetical protein
MYFDPRQFRVRQGSKPPVFSGGITMKIERRQFLHLAAGAVALPVICAIAVALTGQGAWSQKARTVKIVVPVSPGGVIDTLARLVGEQIGRAQEQTILIENRAGAGGVIAAEAVSRATPDGNTLLMTSPIPAKSAWQIVGKFKPLISGEVHTAGNSVAGW